MQDAGVHVPNLVCAATSNSDELFHFEGPTCIEAFLDWLRKLAQDFKLTVLTHNSQGLDSYLIRDAFTDSTSCPTKSSMVISPVCNFASKGPAKSTLTLENGIASLTRKSGSAATGGVLKGFPCSLLHVTHSLNIFLTTCLPFETQNRDLSSPSVERTPLCYTFLWHSSMTNLVKWWSLGMTMGYCASCSKSEFCNLPLHLKMPSSSRKFSFLAR